jgi:hypothetical protein
MVDLPLPELQAKRRLSPPVTAFALKQALWLLAAILISAGCWVAVNEARENDRCETTVSRLAARLNLAPVCVSDPVPVIF